MKEYNFLFKYIVIGDPSVGKTNLLLKFTQNKFTEDYQATIGVEFGAKNVAIKGKQYRIQIWDTAGSEHFRSITRSYYKNSVCAFVVYDITNRESFRNISKWIEDVQDNSPKSINLVLVGNKIDLVDQREVAYEEGEEFAISKGILFGETSAKTGENVDNIFIKSAESIIRKMDENNYNLDSENCGIVRGDKEKMKEFNYKNNQNQNIELEVTKNLKGNQKKGCCS